MRIENNYIYYENYKIDISKITKLYFDPGQVSKVSPFAHSIKIECGRKKYFIYNPSIIFIKDIIHFSNKKMSYKQLIIKFLVYTIFGLFFGIISLL